MTAFWSGGAKIVAGACTAGGTILCAAHRCTKFPACESRWSTDSLLLAQVWHEVGIQQFIFAYVRKKCSQAVLSARGENY